jgi:hypothetical protein
MSYGEAASAFSCNKLTLSEVVTFFSCFYNDFTQEKTVWYAYYSENNTLSCLSSSASNPLILMLIV